MSGEEVKIISYIPAILGLLLVGTFGLINNSKDSKNRAFAVLCLTVSVWLGSLFVADTTHSIPVALWSLRSGLFFGQIVFLLFFFFTTTFPFRSHTNNITRLAWALPTIILSVALLTPLGVASVSVHGFGVQPDRIGSLYVFSDAVGIVYLISGIVLLLSKYRRAEIQQRSQITFVLIGLFIAIIANVFSGVVATLLDVDRSFIWVGSFSLFIFSLFVMYAIIRHKFLDIRLVVARFFAYLVSTLILSAIYGAILLGATNVLFVDKNKSGASIVYLIAALVMAFTFQPVRKVFDRLSNRLFYQDAYDAQHLFDALNRALVSTVELEELLQHTLAIVGGDLKAEFGMVVLLDGHSAQPRIVSTKGAVNNKGFDPADLAAAHSRSSLAKTHAPVIATDFLDSEEHSLKKVLAKNNIALLARLGNGHENGERELGHLMLGPKKSGNPYNGQDIRVMEIVANELVIAIQNALRFEEIEQFNETLQKKVADATLKLRKTNEKLRLLDETKDDFIGMASHQLRTPLTAVKGYLSLVLDGDAGPIKPAQRKMLTQSYISSQRMVYLIADLLNVSRLRTGKFVIEPSPVNLANLVEDELEQIREMSEGRSLTLTYHKPSHFPVLNLDETKTRQVVMNFIDNAVHYTPPGGHITVSLEDKPQTVELRVVDDGIGVPKADQHHLFNKFYRAKNAQKARPDGTGLGLFMAKKVIVAQGGATIFDSKEGKGSVFGFSFPKAALERQAVEKAANSAR